MCVPVSVTPRVTVLTPYRAAYDGLATKQKSLCYVFVRVYVNLSRWLSSLYFRIMKWSSNRDSWDETCNHDGLYLMKLRQRICARWGTVQHQTNAFYFVALKFAGIPRLSYLDRLWRLPGGGRGGLDQKLWLYQFVVIFNAYDKT
jgi:hypothetical protein